MMNFDDLWKLAPDQYQGSESLLKGKIRSIFGLASDIDAVSNRLRYWMDIDRASGGFLDIIASFRNLERNQGESDSDFRDRIKYDVTINNAGTADFVIEKVKSLSGDNSPTYIDEAQAVFFVYTPDGSQLLRRQVRQLAPAGVLGVPGAAIKFLNGNFMLDAGGRRFLAVADDTVNDSKYILTEDGKRILTEDMLAVMTEKNS